MEGNPPEAPAPRGMVMVKPMVICFNEGSDTSFLSGLDMKFRKFGDESQCLPRPPVRGVDFTTPPLDLE